MQLTEGKFTVDTRHPAARGREFTFEQAMNVVETMHLDPRCVRPVEPGTAVSSDVVPAAH